MAKVGDTGYESLSAALAAAADGQTVVITKAPEDADRKLTFTGKKITFKNDTEAALDLTINGASVHLATGESKTVNAGSGENPKTGDETLPLALLIVMVLTVAAGAVVQKKKRLDM